MAVKPQQWVAVREGRKRPHIRVDEAVQTQVAEGAHESPQRGHWPRESPRHTEPVLTVMAHLLIPASRKPADKPPAPPGGQRRDRYGAKNRVAPAVQVTRPQQHAHTGLYVDEDLG